MHLGLVLQFEFWEVCDVFQEAEWEEKTKQQAYLIIAGLPSPQIINMHI